MTGRPTPHEMAWCPLGHAVVTVAVWAPGANVPVFVTTFTAPKAERVTHSAVASLSDMVLRQRLIPAGADTAAPSWNGPLAVKGIPSASLAPQLTVPAPERVLTLAATGPRAQRDTGRTRFRLTRTRHMLLQPM